MSTENQTEQVVEQPKTRKQRSDKGVPRGKYRPRAIAVGPIEETIPTYAPTQETAVFGE